MTAMAGRSSNERVIVLGAGVAGLAAALALRPRPVTVVTPAPVRAGGATAWAQGGIAAALGADDTPARHAADTEAAGAGLCDPAAVAAVTQAAPDAIGWLERLGVRFDRDPQSGARDRALEGGHGRARVLHAGGDRSGAAIRDVLLAAAEASPSIGFACGRVPTALLLAKGRVAGVRLKRGGRSADLRARAVVLATGGYAGLFAGTTNPLGNWGGGLVLAARAGAALRDLEMVQFHPTALAVDADPLPLASETLRGAGARLIDDRGEPVLAGVPGGELAPRDRVAAAVFRARAAGRTVALDTPAAFGRGFAARFPGVAAAAQAQGLDPAVQPIPVRPAAHYTMGGVQAEPSGRTTLPGLWACGEAAATGLHGANRLASNSLLEGVASARRLAETLAAEPAAGPAATPRPASEAAETGMDWTAAPTPVRRAMEAGVGVLRERVGLLRAIGDLRGRADAPAELALMVALAALYRSESRGGHQRSDCPAADPDQAVPRVWTRAQALQAAISVTGGADVREVA